MSEEPENKKTRAKKASKKRTKPHIKKMALKYEAALQKCRKELSAWKLRTVEEEPSGRHAKEFYRDVVRLAESEGFEPRIAKYAGSDEPDIEPASLTGKYPF